MSPLPVHEVGFFMAPERRIEQKNTAQYPDRNFVSLYQVLALATEKSTGLILRIAAIFRRRWRAMVSLCSSTHLVERLMIDRSEG